MAMAGRDECVAVVAPLSSGCCLALEAWRRGYKVIAVWSKELDDCQRSYHPASCKELVFFGQVAELATIEETAAALLEAAKGLPLVACFVGGEAGVCLADALSEHMGLQTNGTQIRRRNKQLQQDLIRQAGLRAVRQAGGRELSEVEDFIASEPLPIVVKPVESAGSDGVKLCQTREEAKEHFLLLRHSKHRVGGSDTAVLCQEFLRGNEYVVDTVSRDGVRKTMMVWAYDKRPANGALFVQYGMVPVPSDSPEAQLLIPYNNAVLDTLQLKHGPSHAEIILTETGPCLVEMNSRIAGYNGAWVPLMKAVTGGMTGPGYSHVDAGVDSFLDPASFASLPDVYVSPLRASGVQVSLVSFQAGVIESTPGLDQIQKLTSCVLFESTYGPGSTVEKTIDLWTNVGLVVLMHHDEEVMKKDLETIRELERSEQLFKIRCATEAVGA